MKIQRLVWLTMTLSLLLYVAIGASVGYLFINQSVKESQYQINSSVAESIVDLLIDPLKQGSVVEARRRIKGFIDRGIFDCADLWYENMPVFRCDIQKDQLTEFRLPIEIYTKSGFNNPEIKFYVNQDKIRSSSYMGAWKFVLALLFFGMFFLFVVIAIFRKTGTEISKLIEELAFKDLKTDLPPSSFIHEVNLLRSRLREYLGLKRTEFESIAKYEIANRVAHDIRAPVQALNAVLALSKEIPDSHREILQSVSVRINDIANDLLKSNRNGTATIKNAEMAVVSLNPIIATIVSEKQLTAKEVKVISEVSLTEDIRIFFNEANLMRIVSNLLDNAIEASGAHGVVRVTSTTNAKTVQIVIVDNGKGIPEEVLSHLGQKRLTFGKESGNGIGVLSAMKEVESGKGKILIKSEVDVGTTVTVIFPIVP